MQYTIRVTNSSISGCKFYHCYDFHHRHICSFLPVQHLFQSSLSLSMVFLKSLKAPITSETPETRWINVTCDHLLYQVMKMSHSTFFSIIVICPQPSYENENIFIFFNFCVLSKLMKVLTFQIFIFHFFISPILRI